ncbi:MAG: hypothetical protein NDJ18_01255 [candidate division Zixibacteria bacterium]|nr:hypothetical protein [candidate division Zixibacteria bacterium]
MPRIIHTIVISLALITLVMADAAVAQQAAEPPMLTDPRMVVIPTRTAAEITTDMENVRATHSLAEIHRQQAEERLARIDATIDTRKAAIDEVNRRKDEAKRAQRRTEAIALDLEKKANEQAVDLLKKLKDLRKAEVEAAKTEAELADTQLKTLGLELELVRKRIEYDSLYVARVGDLALSTHQQVLRELEVRVLKSQKDQAEATQKVASKQKDIITRRTKLHEAQLKMGMPR